MTMRFGSRMNPRSSGENRCVYFTTAILAACTRPTVGAASAPISCVARQRLENSVRDLRHQAAREGVLRRDQQRTLQRLARTHHVALVDERATEEGVGLRGAPLR